MTFQKTRLQIRHERAQDQANAADAAFVQTQLDIAKESTQFFEKLAIGSGVAITALVSFLGAHPKCLRPPWVLKTSLVALGVAIFTALCRSWTYPWYAQSAADIRRSKSRIEEQQMKRERNLQGGGEQPTDAKETADRLAKLIKDGLTAIPKKKCVERRRRGALKVAEAFCLSAVFVAMFFLVWLALVNF